MELAVKIRLAALRGCVYLSSACLLLLGLAGCQGISGSNPVQGGPNVTAVSVNPSSATVSPGSTQQFTAVARYTDGSQKDVTQSAAWSTSNSSVATIHSGGMASAVALGTTAVTATLNNSAGLPPISATATLNVATTAKSLSSIAVTPSGLNLSPGASQQLTATGTFSDGSQADETSLASWTSSNPAVATVSAGGMVTAVAPGSVTITASVESTSGTISGSDAVTVATAPPPPPAGNANVPTWHYDNKRTGLNDSETALTPADVNAQSFGKLFSYLVDGYIYAQPLYVSNLSINGAAHNVVFVATQNDSVYAFDADQPGNGAPLWQVSLLRSGESPMTGASIKPVLGVTSTPAIDLASNTMYVVSAQQGSSGAFFRLHALDIRTGAEKFGGPVVIQASVAGTNSDSNGTTVSLTTSWVQRAALLVANGAVYIAFGGWHSGWLLAYDARSLSQIGVFNSSPNADGIGTFKGAGGIWMGGGGPAADDSGAVYVTTGNGPYDGSTAWGDSLLKFNTNLNLLDHFTPADWLWLECDDLDLSGGGVMLVPGTTQAVVGGKQGKMFLVDTTNMGGMQANDAGATQWLWFEQDLSPAYTGVCNANNAITGQATNYQIFGTAAFFGGSAYLGITHSTSGSPGPVRQFLFSGQLSYGSFTQDSIAPGSYGTTPFISSDGTANGIVWMIDHGTPIQAPGGATPTSAILRAYDANDLTNEIYNSAQNAADAAGLGIKFTSPIVANGKVYMGTGHDPLSTANPQGELDVYGLKQSFKY